ncbi:hypothetical protein [Vagococcus carniphilus]|uniref:HNH endonuclease n=1 Tax=Vagococcus carniphilus TaxID=218144 RepID=A0AAW8U473_9ENTE|nr:hypothetical protein [Vagococcus carniphilus]MDT2813352.1 hypothetical protein [Vagococcus carniphilus]MDT2830194.1 hypothetical protein [Vagococcus carniphilus]MDT2833879.1 hypothetical protein [Vagococcus carniphilus]MDT2838626.1 hypothetical protein [Vagococcus carniphilus]MDT2853464.1 hypothetical protein [Vagococcus carniphilus]
MLQDYLYIHLDAISNSILSKGMSHEDFNRYTLNRPENLLLLNHNEREGEYETHTGFRVIRGTEEVNQYFSLVESRSHREIKWVDFNEYDVLKRLTPNEISELLYFGHMKTQLRSPFFYQLQNNFAFFELNPETIKIYYRNIEDFYQTLSQKITNIVSRQASGPRTFFNRKTVTVSELPKDMVSHLKGAMQEGIVFNFSQVGFVNDQYIVPIHVVEDNLRKVDNYHFKQEIKIGTLIYSQKSNEWEIVKEEFESILLKQ